MNHSSYRLAPPSVRGSVWMLLSDPLARRPFSRRVTPQLEEKIAYMRVVALVLELLLLPRPASHLYRDN